MVRRSPSSSIYFFDVARSKRDHNLLVWAELMSLDGLAPDSAAQFTSDVESRLKSSEGRFRVLEAEAIPYQAHNTDCERTRRVGEESGNWQFPGVLFVETRAGFIYSHPHDPRLGVVAAYTESRPSGAASLLIESLKQEMEEMLATVLFGRINWKKYQARVHRLRNSSSMIRLHP